MRDAYHLVPSAYDDDGFPVWETPLTPTNNTKRALVMAPPDRIIPIIFVPGIMGSNLKVRNSVQPLKRAGEVAWRPDIAGIAEARLTGGQRQSILNPKNTEVDKRFVQDKKKGISTPSTMSVKCAESRGWGSVYWKSYGDLLIHLELTLNMSCFFDPTAGRVIISSAMQSLIDQGVSSPGQANLKLLAHEVARMSSYWYPVHAVGYNWLQSNELAGKYLATEIRRIKKFYQNKLDSEDACRKVIVITHSMGGLVARAAVHPSIGNIGADVLGIVHGVMPAIGAAAAYKRMRTGFEHGEIDWLSLGNVSAELGGQAVAGRNGRDVTAVLGHSPGGLQLLPNKDYHPDGWLKCVGVGNEPSTIPLLGNPYKSIYLEPTKWWRLINPEWLDPARIFIGDGSITAWGSFKAALSEAEEFHDKLGNYYHENTYCFFGADPLRRPSYGMVKWEKAPSTHQGHYSPVDSTAVYQSIVARGSAFFRADDATGIVAGELNRTVLVFRMTKATDSGDGTVPVVSGAAPRKYAPSCVREQIGILGIDHQGAYKVSNDVVIDFLRYSICKITRDAK